MPTPAKLVRKIAFALTAAACGITCSAAPVVFEVANGQWERFRQPVSVQVSPEIVAALDGRKLVELDAGGSPGAPVSHALDTSAAGAPVLAWILPGITTPGATRRFAALADTAPPPTESVTDLSVTTTEKAIVVSNSYCAVQHPLRGNGGFPKRVVYQLSGHEESNLMFLDRLYRRETRKQYSAEHDSEARTCIVFQSPVRVVLESRTGYRAGTSEAPGNVRAVYRYVYTPYSPVVEVTATITRDDTEFWNELHFLELSREDYHYTSFVTGDPPAQHVMQQPGTKSRTHSGRNWAVMATEDDAMGVGFNGVACWDASDEYYYYTSAARGQWTEKTRTFSGGLYFGPAKGNLSWYSRWLGPDRELRVRTLLGGDVQIVGGAPTPTPKGAHELRNNAMHIVFADAESGFDCLAVENLLGGTTRFVETREDTPGLWKLEFRKPAPQESANEEKKAAHESVFLTNRDTAATEAKLEKAAEKTELVLRWKGLDLPDEADAVDVTARVALGTGEAASEWRITVANRSKRLGLWETQFPLLSTVAPKGTADVALPGGNWGGRLLRRSKSSCNAYYPSTACPAQFMAFNLGRAGLYVAAHDDAARAKRLVVTAQQDVTIATYAEGMGVPGSSQAAPFPVVVAAYQGDWWEAARIYRQWATQQVWTRKGWIADRKDIPQEFMELGVWMLGGGHAQEARKMMMQAEELFPFTVGLHWYNWHMIPFDHTYPEYFPTKPGVPDVVRELVNRKQIMMPYINGRLWDRDIDSFQTGIAGACKQPNGDVYTEIYGSKRRLSPMCPATKLWQDKVNEICEGLINDVGVNAIYLDQIGAARPKLCFDPTHGHPLGGGRHWVDGYRTMLNRTKATAAAHNVALTTENTAEPYMDNIEGYLAWIPRFDTDIPLLPAVYSGYTVYFTSPQDAKDTPRAFRQAQARDFLWGCQLGWNGGWILSDAHREKADFLIDLCEYRLACKEFLVYGQLLNELRPTNAMPSITTTWNRRKPHPATLPVIMGTLWRTRDNTLAIFAVNVDDQAHRLAATVDIARWLRDADAPHGWLISRRSPKGQAPFMRVDSDDIGLDHILEAGEILALVASAATAATPAESAKRAKALLADNSTHAPLKQAAETFLFDEACRRASLTVDLPRQSVRVPGGEPVDLAIRFKNTGNVAPTVLLTWPDGHRQAVSVPAGKTTQANRIFWPTSDAKRWQETIAVKLPAVAPGETYRLPIRGHRVPAVSVALGTPPDVHGGESFMLPLEIRNNSRSTRDVVLQLDAPDTWHIEPTRQIVFNDFAPGARRDVLLKCRVPDASAATVEELNVRVLEQAGKTSVKILKSRPRTEAKRFDKAPIIDGNLQDWHGEPVVAVGPDQPDSVKISGDYNGAADCSARVRFGWNKTHFFLAAEVRDNIQHQEETEFQIWRGDCIQLAFRNGPPNPKTGYDGTEFEVGLTLGPHGNPILFQWVPGACLLTDGTLAVTRQNDTTVYEAAIPWAALGISNVLPGGRTSWSMTVNDNDGKGFRGWLEWTPGVCGSKDSSAFGWMTFRK